MLFSLIAAMTNFFFFSFGQHFFYTNKLSITFTELNSIQSIAKNGLKFMWNIHCRFEGVQHKRTIISMILIELFPIIDAPNCFAWNLPRNYDVKYWDLIKWNDRCVGCRQKSEIKSLSEVVIVAGMWSQLLRFASCRLNRVDSSKRNKKSFGSNFQKVGNFFSLSLSSLLLLLSLFLSWRGNNFFLFFFASILCGICFLPCFSSLNFQCKN